MAKDSNKIKDSLLGMSHGTAANQLRKMIMFNMMQRLGEDTCFRCGKKIERIEDLSVEHIEAWQQAKNPKESFFDLGNITFSHLKCNIAVGKRLEKQPAVHGLSSTYKSGKCKCPKCTNAQKMYMREWRNKNI